MQQVAILMPHMGQSIAEGTVVKWHKTVGEEIAADELIVEVESDKVAFEVTSPASGILTACHAAEGEVADVGTAIGTIDTEDEVSGTQQTLAAAPAPDAPEASAPAPAAPAAPAASGRERTRDLPELTREWLSPSVSRLALRHNVSLTELEALRGSGRNGRVTRYDLLEYLSTRTAAAATVSPLPARSNDVDLDRLNEQGRVVPMTAIRRSIADHMVQSIHTSAHVTMVHALDVTALVALREGGKAAFRRKHGVNITYTAIMLYVTGRVLRDFPMINASTFGAYILQRDAINIGCAVALPDESLVVPVIRDADTRSLLEIARDLDRLVRVARNRELSREDIDSGTFTISNFGTFGTLFGTPIINQPQVAILGMGAITKQPVPDGASFTFRDTLYLSFSFDHRVIDGAMAGRFLQGLQDGVSALNAGVLDLAGGEESSGGA